jgi:uncharacterized damage-inducible protein DinB
MTDDADPAADPRTDPPRVGEERELLDAWLDFHRDTLLWKCAGLSDEQLKTAACPPSNLTLLGLVRHMAEVERGWLAEYAGSDQTWIFCTADDLDGDFDNVAEADVSADLAVYRREVALFRQALPQVSLDARLTHVRGGERHEFNLRWVLLHLIEEYARHNGHADLLRERIDGKTGA